MTDELTVAKADEDAQRVYAKNLLLIEKVRKKACRGIKRTARKQA